MYWNAARDGPNNNGINVEVYVVKKDLVDTHTTPIRITIARLDLCHEAS
jgi:hypothetical protein